MPAVLEYKCPSCGGGIAFDSEEQKMKCPYCYTEFDADVLHQFNAVQEDRSDAEVELQVNGTLWEDDRLQGFICPSCAGELIGDSNTAATRCPYCGNPAVLPNRLSGVYRPSEIIPFQLDKEAAIQAFKSNLKGKRLLPKYFKQDSTLGDFTGIYVPFWLFDCDISGNASYRAKMVSTWSDSHYQYTKTDHYQLRRAGNATYVHIPVDGSKKLDDAMMDAIEPFDYTGFKPFEMSYLSGYLADRFDVDAQTCSPRAENRARSSLQQNLISSTSGYGLCTPEHEYSWISRKEAKYTLLPVWTLNATYKNKKYRFAMNGQTGKLIGELPVSAGKGAAWFFGIFGGIAAVSAAIAAIAGGVFG